MKILVIAALLVAGRQVYSLAGGVIVDDFNNDGYLQRA